MKALTIKQPWASLCVNYGPRSKDIENRTWEPPKDLIGQRIAIHSSGKLDYREYGNAMSLILTKKLAGSDLIRRELPLGCIIGTVVLKGFVRRHHPSPWFFGPVGFVFADPIRLAEPIRTIGGLGFWDVGATAEARIKQLSSPQDLVGYRKLE